MAEPITQQAQTDASQLVQQLESTRSTSGETAGITQAITDAWGPRTQAAQQSRSTSDAPPAAPTTDAAPGSRQGRSTTDAPTPGTAADAAQRSQEGRLSQILNGVDRPNVVREGHMFGRLNDNSVNGQLNDAINQAIENAMQNVLNNRQWDIRFAGAIRSADRELANHPKLGAELMEAAIALKKSENNINTLQAQIDKSISALPAWEQRLIRNLENSKQGHDKLYDYLKENHPDILKQYQARDKGYEDYNKAAQKHNELQKIADGPQNARLDYARFLARRGNPGDMNQLSALLADIVNKDNSVANPYKQQANFHAVRDLAKLSGADKDPVFLKALKDAGIQPDLYFNPKFDFQGWKKEKPGLRPINAINAIGAGAEAAENKEKKAVQQ